MLVNSIGYDMLLYMLENKLGNLKRKLEMKTKKNTL